MSDVGRPEVAVAAPPHWLEPPLLRALEAERNRQFAWGRDALAARSAVQDVLLALRPALPLPMIAEAVEAVVPDAEGLTGASGGLGAGAAVPPPATRQEVAEALSYALRFGLDGKPRRTGHEHLAPLAAAQLAEHLMRSGFVISRGSCAAGNTGRVGRGGCGLSSGEAFPVLPARADRLAPG